jgi:beta-N-acetylglucosaminidase
MLFNPENPGVHEYATDCEWATSQALILDRIFTMFPDAIKTYEVPVYSGMEPTVLDTTD